MPVLFEAVTNDLVMLSSTVVPGIHTAMFTIDVTSIKTTRVAKQKTLAK